MGSVRGCRWACFGSRRERSMVTGPIQRRVDVTQNPRGGAAMLPRPTDAVFTLKPTCCDIGLHRVSSRCEISSPSYWFDLSMLHWGCTDCIHTVSQFGATHLSFGIHAKSVPPDEPALSPSACSVFRSLIISLAWV